MDNVELYFDFIFIVLLSLMIFYSLKLNKQLKDFRSHKTDFKSIMKDLNVSFGQADKNIKGFHDIAQESQGDLENKLLAAQSLSDELKFMIESADRIATRLEKANASQITKKNESEEEKADIDYYKETSPASSAVRRDAALSVDKGTSSKISVLDRKRSEVSSRKLRSKTEKDLLKVLKVKTR